MGDEAPFCPLTAAKKKKDDKHRRRDPRSWENVKKATLNMSDEEREAFLSKMYTDMYNENRNLFLSLQAREKQLSGMQKDSDRDRSELTKSILARGHLESLCRELQKQNKLIKEENVARIKEEEDRRREVANTFTERLNALTNLITESKDKSNKVKEENQNMTEKLTELYEQYQQRENHLETVTRQLDLQKKLAETQAKKTEIENEAERQTNLAEKKALVMQLEQYEREIVLLQEKNRSLEAQVDLYKSQYSDFETTMTKSNKVFDTFKEEMSRMNKQLHALETERNDLRKRWQSSVNSLIGLSEQHVALSNEQSALEKRLAMLQKLCRQLQEDRSAFLKQLKENNIEPVVPVVKSENCENDATQQNSDTAKSTQRALKLKQELGKVKEVAALVRLGHDTFQEDNSLEDLHSDGLMDLDAIQNQIERSEKAFQAQYDNGDQPRAGPSGAAGGVRAAEEPITIDEEEPIDMGAEPIYFDEDTIDVYGVSQAVGEESRSLSDNHTQTMIETCESSSQSVYDTFDVGAQYDGMMCTDASTSMDSDISSRHSIRSDISSKHSGGSDAPSDAVNVGSEIGSSGSESTLEVSTSSESM